MEDIQSADGLFIENIVNSELLPKMRALGFAIPEDVTAMMENDTEQEEIVDKYISRCVESAKAGLKIDAKDFEKRTGIVVSEVVEPKPEVKPNENKEFDVKVKNKLDALYGHKNCNCKTH